MDDKETLFEPSMDPVGVDLQNPLQYEFLRQELNLARHQITMLHNYFLRLSNNVDQVMEQNKILTARLFKVEAANVHQGIIGPSKQISLKYRDGFVQTETDEYVPCSTQSQSVPLQQLTGSVLSTGTPSSLPVAASYRERDMDGNGYYEELSNSSSGNLVVGRRGEFSGACDTVPASPQAPVRKKKILTFTDPKTNMVVETTQNVCKQSTTSSEDCRERNPPLKNVLAANRMGDSLLDDCVDNGNRTSATHSGLPDGCFPASIHSEPFEAVFWENTIPFEENKQISDWQTVDKDEKGMGIVPVFDLPEENSVTACNLEFPVAALPRTPHFRFGCDSDGNPTYYDAGNRFTAEEGLREHRNTPDTAFIACYSREDLLDISMMAGIHLPEYVVERLQLLGIYSPRIPVFPDPAASPHSTLVQQTYPCLIRFSADDAIQQLHSASGIAVPPLPSRKKKLLVFTDPVTANAVELPQKAEPAPVAMNGFAQNSCVKPAYTREQLLKIKREAMGVLLPENVLAAINGLRILRHAGPELSTEATPRARKKKLLYLLPCSETSVFTDPITTNAVYLPQKTQQNQGTEDSCACDPAGRKRLSKNESRVLGGRRVDSNVNIPVSKGQRSARPVPDGVVQKTHQVETDNNPHEMTLSDDDSCMMDRLAPRIHNWIQTAFRGNKIASFRQQPAANIPRDYFQPTDSESTGPMSAMPLCAVQQQVRQVEGPTKRKPLVFMDPVTEVAIDIPRNAEEGTLGTPPMDSTFVVFETREVPAESSKYSPEVAQNDDFEEAAARVVRAIFARTIQERISNVEEPKQAENNFSTAEVAVPAKAGDIRIVSPGSNKKYSEKKSVKIDASQLWRQKALNMGFPLAEVDAALTADLEMSPDDKITCVQDLIEKILISQNAHNQFLSANEREERGLCKICLDEDCNVIFLPCRHLASCESCSLRWNGSCPVCRGNVKEKMVIFQ